MDLKQIKLIIELMKRSELTEFAVEEEGFKLKIRRGAAGLPVVSMGAGASPSLPVMEQAAPSPAAAVPSATAGNPGAGNGIKDEVGVTYVKSPMVGTFYRAASPESKPFVDSGSKISENSVVCIIEAMKIMNEIQAETKGTIIVENGQPVEYGQRLFKVKQG